MHGSRSRIPSKKSRQAVLRGAILLRRALFMKISNQNLFFYSRSKLSDYFEQLC
jgi:hypothetical protein